MTPSELKAAVESAGHDSHFFERSSLKFFGDRMSNYGVCAKPVTVETHSGTYQCWELYRKRPVKHGLQSSAFFDTQTFRRVLPKR